MNSFVITGKSRKVFDLVALKAKQEEAREKLEREIKGHSCPFSPEARCNKPEDATCASIGCRIWLETATSNRRECTDVRD